MADANNAFEIDHNNDIFELFADSESEDGEFEGFDPVDDNDENNENFDRDDLFDDENWAFEDRDPTS